MSLKRGPYKRMPRQCPCGITYHGTAHTHLCPLCRRERKREQQREWARRNKVRVIQSRLTPNADE